MRSMNLVVSATLVAAGVAGNVGMAPSAWAYDPAINGTYTATVVGDWARTREVYHQEAVVRSTWKVTTSCSTAQDCKGIMSFSIRRTRTPVKTCWGHQSWPEGITRSAQPGSAAPTSRCISTSRSGWTK